jgi:hypothetical protein
LLKALPFGHRAPGGGLYDCVSNNVLRSLRFQNFVMGIVASGQCRAVLENIEGNYRGSWYRSFEPTRETGSEMKYIGPPGHLIYLTFQDAFDVVRSQDAPNGRQVFHSTTRNADVVLRNVTEGPETLSNINSLGTLALKNMQGGLVLDVVSHHPAGLIQSMIDAHELRLENLTWSSDRDICDEAHPPLSCGVPVITLEPGPPDPDTAFSSGLQFKNIKLQGPRRSVIFKISEESGQLPLSRNITVDGLTIECNPSFTPNQHGPLGAITVRSLDTHFTSVHYIPRIPGNAMADRQNFPAVIQSRSQNTTLEITIERGRDTRNNPAGYKCVVEDQMNNKCQIVP